MGEMSATDGKTIYELRNLVKSYSGREVVHVDSLTIKRGEILAIVGPSGAGKSTLLRLLDFLEPPTQGTLFFDGYTVNGVTPPLSIRRRSTTVFQRPVLLNNSVFDNVSYGLRIRGRRNWEKQVAEAIEMVGLKEFARAPARTLSGGEAQRVALARALVIEPDVLLLDEPTANLDPYNVRLIEEIIRDLNRLRGTTIVLVTHNVFQARRLAHRAALMLEGRMVEVAPVDVFFELPSDPRTASFVSGDMVY
jgi:tungstate transport system ATP-binding protein